MRLNFDMQRVQSTYSKFIKPTGRERENAKAWRGKGEHTRGEPKNSFSVFKPIRLIDRLLLFEKLAFEKYGGRFFFLSSFLFTRNDPYCATLRIFTEKKPGISHGRSRFPNEFTCHIFMCMKWKENTWPYFEGKGFEKGFSFISLFSLGMISIFLKILFPYPV